MARVPTLVGVFVVLLVLLLSALHIIQLGPTIRKFPQTLFLKKKSSASFNSPTIESPKKDTADDDRNQQCISLLKKYSGEPFWDTFLAGRDEHDPNVEVFPHALQDPIILMSNQTIRQRGRHGRNKVIRQTPKLPNDFAFCTIPKNGCSRWRKLFRRVMGYEDYLLFAPHDRRTNGLQYSIHFSPDIFHRTSTMSVEEALLNRGNDENDNVTSRILFRIVLVRDPLARALSAWNSKIRRNIFLPKCPSHLNITGKFEDFITCLYQPMEPSPCQWNPHYSPQTCFCNIEKMKYDMLLPVEEMDDWVQPFMSCLGIEKYAQSYVVDNEGRHFDFTSKQGRSFGSNETGSNDLHKLCSMYNKTVLGKNGSSILLYDMAREVFKSDTYFSSWTMSDCLLLDE